MRLQTGIVARTRTAALACLAVVWLMLGCPGPPGPAMSIEREADPFGDACWRTAVNYAEAMLVYGRDRFGPENSPLFAAALERTSYTLPVEPPPAGLPEATRTIRGANPMLDQNLYQVLWWLTEVGYDPRWRAEAERTLDFFLHNCQSTTTGLYAWGENLGWDLLREGAGLHVAGRGLHRFARPWALQETALLLAPQDWVRFADGLWAHHVWDKQHGYFVRATPWAGGATERVHDEDPRHGGFFILTWAWVWQYTHEPKYLKYIDTLLKLYEEQARRSPWSIAARRASLERPQAARAEPEAPKATPPPGELPRDPHSELRSNLSQAIDLADAARALPRDLSGRIDAYLQNFDAFYLGLPHLREGNSFITDVCSDTGGRRSECLPWRGGHGAMTEAAVAMMCLRRWQQTRHRAYRDLVLSAADRYINFEPDPEQMLTPGVLGDAIALEVAAYRLRHQRRHIVRAEQLAQMAFEMFFADGPLPSASNRHDHYEAVTRGDTLVLALLDLWLAKYRPTTDPGFAWVDR